MGDIDQQLFFNNSPNPATAPGFLCLPIVTYQHHNSLIFA